jgi:hypothetical protein
MTKELRVYVCPIFEPYFKYLKTINMPKDDCGAYMIDRWTKSDGELPPEALAFLTLCEESGSVYSLEGFQSAINRDYLNLTESYVFITDKY